jgi:membrane protease YdiL (CAAX protease family)
MAGMYAFVHEETRGAWLNHRVNPRANSKVFVIRMDAQPDQHAVHHVERRERWGLWMTLAWGAGAALVLAATQTAGALLYLSLRGLLIPGQPIAVENLENNGPMLTAAFLFSTPFVVGYLALAVRLAKIPFREYMALRWPSWRDILAGIGTLAAVIFIAGVGATLSGQETPDFMSATFRTAREEGMLPLFFFSFIALAPIQEELIFRGFLYRGLSHSLGPWPSILLLSAVWAVVHSQYNWFYVTEIFMLGVAFGWLRHTTGSTILTIILHAAMNAMALIYAGATTA